MSEALVEIQDLIKLFSPEEPPALDKINVSISKGKIIGLVGPDGAGKTTLIRLMAGLLKPTAGSITVEGYDTIKDAEFIHYLTGYMPQKFGLYEDLTVKQNLDLYANLRNVLGKEKEATCEKLLGFTGLKDFTGFLAKNLSGGMKQKLGLACALIKTPAFLLLDEPSVGVDPISRQELWKMVNVLLDEGISVLWSTAYLDEAEKCDVVLLLNEGKLLYSGDPKKLTDRVEGRVFEVTNIEGDRRKLLFELLKDKNVMDGVIQGRDLRIVVREKGIEVIPSLSRNLALDTASASDLQQAQPSRKQAMFKNMADGRDCKDEDAGAVQSQISRQVRDKGAKLESVQPRFEDAFIDILGGGPGGESKLADLAPVVKNDDKPAIIAENLTKKFGPFIAVDGISLTVKKGEIFGLLGPNGAGKTTTFKMLCGLLKPTSGEAFVNGLDLLRAPAKARARLGYMAQKFSLYGNLSVRQNLEFFAGIYNLTNAEKKAAIDEMIEVFSLEPYLNHSSETLPLGFKQRLSLACANMHHPEVLFLDEPTSGVDPITRREFWNHINGLVGKGVTIMITTHFMGEAEYCDRIALIYGGEIIQMDTPNALKDKIKSDQNPNPTLEDAFIQMIENHDK